MESMGGQVVACVGDNHSGIQLALELLTQKFSNIFRVRCKPWKNEQFPLVGQQVRCSLLAIADGRPVQDRTVIHGLQTWGKDSHAFSGLAVSYQLLDKLCMSQDVDEASKLEDVQRAAKNHPLQLVRPVATRWNSIFDAHNRMVCDFWVTLTLDFLVKVLLKTAINAVVPFSSSDWESMEQSVKIMMPLAAATDVCQGDDASVATVLEELRKLPAHFQGLAAEFPSLQPFFKAAQVVAYIQ